MDAESLKRLKKFIEHLPKAEQNRTIIIINENLLSWREVIEKLKKNDKLAKEIEKKLMERLQ